jgi:predicted site-specific integrase-resolvase
LAPWPARTSHGPRQLLGDEPELDDAPAVATQRILYARVSSAKQRVSGDLQRQVDALVAAYPDHTCVVTDVASGLNFKRKGLLAILDRVHAGVVHEVVVAHRDRLCRFGIELLEHFFKQNRVRLVVHDHVHRDAGDSIEPPDRTAELAEDLIAITTVFVARHHGHRSAENRRERARTAAAKKRKRDGAESEAGAEESSDASRAGGEGDASAAEPPPKRRAHADGAEGAALPHA